MKISKFKTRILESRHKLLFIILAYFGLFCCNQSNIDNKLHYKQNNRKSSSYINPDLASTENSIYDNIITKTNDTGYFKSLKQKIKKKFRKKNSKKEKCNDEVKDIEEIDVGNKKFDMTYDSTIGLNINPLGCEIDKKFWNKIVNYSVNKDSEYKNNQKDSGGFEIVLVVTAYSMVVFLILLLCAVLIKIGLESYKESFDKKTKKIIRYPITLSFIQQFYLPYENRKFFRYGHFGTSDENLKNLLEKLQKLDDSKREIIKINEGENPNSKSISLYSLLKLAEYHIKDFYYIGLYLTVGFEKKNKQLITKLRQLQTKISSQDKIKKEKKKNSKLQSKIKSKLKKLVTSVKYKILVVDDHKNVKKLLENFYELGIFKHDFSNPTDIRAKYIKELIIWLNKFKCAKEKLFRTYGKFYQDYIYFTYKKTLIEINKLNLQDNNEEKEELMFAHNLRKKNGEEEIDSKLETINSYLKRYDKEQGNIGVTPKEFKLLIEILEGIDLNKVCLGIGHSYYEDDATPKQILERYLKLTPDNIRELIKKKYPINYDKKN